MATRKKVTKYAGKPTIESRLCDIGIDAICSRIECGESMREISISLSIPISGLSSWLANDDNRDRSARAKELSAESWLDKGLDAVERAMDKRGDVDASAAKAYAQECARRAALRNPRYVEKTAHEVSGPDGGAVQTKMTVEYILPPAR